ncbi:MAG: TetR family transcriptional regulator [Propionibacteriales bacterium]|nr:TetR family transcriptional regulator [Propionibacteriales bacterium]
MSSPSPTIRRRLDVAARRTAILDAARSCYASGTYAEVSVAQIAAAAHASSALVFHYFNTKAELYAAVVADAVAGLAAAQRTAVDALPVGTSRRDRVATSIAIYLDHIAGHPQTWAAPLTGGEEPAEAIAVRQQARADYVQALRELLQPTDWARHDYALWGYFGFLDEACLRWVQRGCPADEREPLREAALGALEGALGDWGG